MTKRKREYQRTAALLGAQPQNAQHTRVRGRRRVQVHVPWRVVAIGLVLILAGLWFWLDSRWYVAPERLRIGGTASLELARDVALAGGVLDVHGLWIRPRQVVSRVLTTVPAITDAQADCRRYPAGCLITIEEREAVFAWVTDDQTYWVDPQGVLFTARADRELPTLRGPLPDPEQVSPRIWEGLQELITLGVPVEALTYDPTSGLIWTDPAGRRVIFGVGAAMPARWHVYQALVAELAARDVAVRTIDVRFPGGPTYVTE